MSDPAQPQPPLSSPGTITIEVCVAWPTHAIRQELQLPAGSLLADVRQHPHLMPDLAQAWDAASGIGVFGEVWPARRPLRDGDRIELWRPLVADPKEARRLRARMRAARKERSV